MTLRVRARDVRRDNVRVAERHIHALSYQDQYIFGCTESERQFVATYLVEFSISTVKHHLEGDIGPILNARYSRSVGHDADASGRTRSLEVIDDQLICTRRGVEVVEGFGGSRGREQHTN